MLAVVTPLTYLLALALAVPLGLIPAYIAKGKGDPQFGSWWVFGSAMFIVALPAALLVGPFQPEEPKPTAPERPAPQPIEASGAQVAVVGAVLALALGGTLVALL